MGPILVIYGVRQGGLLMAPLLRFYTIQRVKGHVSAKSLSISATKS